jgi:2OG-Fe(II) oxygenase superfamily
MKRVIPRYRDNRVAVYDNFLTEDEQQEILRYLDAAKFHRVLPDAWGQAFRLINGDPLIGDEVVSAKRFPDDRAPAYPTKTALDPLIERLFSCRTDVEEIVGTYGDAWTYFNMFPYVYPAGSGLGWHSDAHTTGAYIYYAHTSWSFNWGGELLIEHSEQDGLPYTTSSRGILRNSTLEAALRHGMGYYFAPTPNRVIFIRSTTPHMIKAVEAAAGENLRLSLSGFFFPSE